MTSRPLALARRIVLVASLLVGPGLVVTAAPAQAYTPSATTVAAFKNRVIYQINVQRARYNHYPLAYNWCPYWYAGYWAPYLARTGLFYHRPMDQILQGCHAARAAENLARGYTTADATVYAWMASTSHRANVLDPLLTRVGVAAVYARGQWTVVADFTHS